MTFCICYYVARAIGELRPPGTCIVGNLRARDEEVLYDVLPESTRTRHGTYLYITNMSHSHYQREASNARTSSAF